MSIPDADSFFIFVEIIEQMNLSSRVDGDLITGPDAKAWIVGWTIVHQAFSGRRISLFIEGARDREATRKSGL